MIRSRLLKSNYRSLSMIERYQRDMRTRVVCSLIGLLVVALVVVVTGSPMWGGLTGCAIGFVFALLGLRDNPSPWRGR